MSEEHTVHFSIEADYFMHMVRSIWADDKDPDKALRILKSAFPEMGEPDMLAILSGCKKLVDVEGGMDLVADNATETEHGNSLSLQTVLEDMHGKLRKEKGLQRDAVELLNSDYECIASPYGLIRVPRNRIKAYKAKKSEADQYSMLNDMLYQCTGLRNDMQFEDDPMPLVQPTKMELDGPLDEDDVGPEPLPIPESSDKITYDTGWLSPEGKFYKCESVQHLHILDALGLDSVAAEKAGWVKLCEKYGPLGSFDTKPTQRQIDMLFDWYTSQGKELPWCVTNWLEDK